MGKDISPEPISVSMTVLSQMFLYLASLNVDIDEFLGSLGIDPAVVKPSGSRGGGFQRTAQSYSRAIGEAIPER